MRRWRMVMMAASVAAMMRAVATVVMMVVTAMVLGFRMVLVMRASFVLVMLCTVRGYLFVKCLPTSQIASDFMRTRARQH